MKGSNKSSAKWSKSFKVLNLPTGTSDDVQPLSVESYVFIWQSSLLPVSEDGMYSQTGGLVLGLPVAISL